MDRLFIILFVVTFIVAFVVTFVITVKTVKKNGSRIKNIFNESDELINIVKKNFDKQQNPDKYKKHCEYCGAVLEDDAVKCECCGAKVTEKGK